MHQDVPGSRDFLGCSRECPIFVTFGMPYNHLTSYVARDITSQVIGEGSGPCYEWSSYIRGYHEYKEVWTPTLGEMLQLKIEPTNPSDQFAVAVIKAE